MVPTEFASDEPEALPMYSAMKDRIDRIIRSGQRETERNSKLLRQALGFDDQSAGRRGRKPPRLDQFVSQRPPVRIIQAEHPHRHLANFGSSDHAFDFYREVPGPVIDPRIEQTNQRPADISANVAALGAIAERTAKRQVVRLGRPVMLLADDVIDVERMNAVLFV